METNTDHGGTCIALGLSLVQFLAIAYKLTDGEQTTTPLTGIQLFLLQNK